MTDRLRLRLRASLRLLISAALLLGLVWLLDPLEVWASWQAARIALDPWWLAPALLMVLPQLVLSAWRWRFTAGRLGMALPMRRALGEYYLASFINQVLPGGVAGDLGRAWRHARWQQAGAAAWHAVLIERLSGQLAMILLAVLGVAASPALRAAAIEHGVTTSAGSALLLLVLLGGVVWGWARMGSRLRAFGRDLKLALIQPDVLAVQLVLSLLLAASYVLVFVCCARAIGVARPLAELLPLLPPVLLAMALPLTMAGWGVREGAAAGVWLLAGLPPAEGLAVSLVYGVVVLLSSVPGGLLLLRRGGGLAAQAGEALPPRR